MSPKLVRPAQKNDVLKIVAILKEVFTDTYGPALKQAVLESFLTQQFSEEKVAAELEHYRLAQFDNKVVGLLKLRSLAQQRLELEKLYISKEARAMGFGKLLIDDAVAGAGQLQAKCLWVKVWQENRGALAFYKARGFSKIGVTEVHVFETVFHDDVLAKVL